MALNQQAPRLGEVIRKNFPALSDPNLLAQISEAGRLLSFAAGEVIMNYGSYIKMVPLVIEGSIKVMREGDDGEELLLYYLNAGEVCSMSFACCMSEKKSGIKTIAEDHTTLIGIPIQYVDQWMHEFPAWRNFVMLSYDNRIKEMVKTIDSIAFNKMDQRLLDYLRKKAKANNSQVISVTHQEIAYDMNASRETVSRLLKQLEASGSLVLGRNKIELIDLTD